MDKALELMRDAKTIAVVGIAKEPHKASNFVSKYLIDAGYKVYLVNPEEPGPIHGQPVYDRLQDIPEHIDVVDVFRRAEAAGDHVDEAIAVGAGAVWLQLGVVDEAAAARARAAGLAVVMDRCPAIDHPRFFPAGRG